MVGLTWGQTDRVEFVGLSSWAGRSKFSYNLYCNGDTSSLYVTRTGICKSKALDNIPPFYFWSGSVSKDFQHNEVNEISLKGTVYDFSADYILNESCNHCNIYSAWKMP